MFSLISKLKGKDEHKLNASINLPSFLSSQIEQFAWRRKPLPRSIGTKEISMTTTTEKKKKKNRLAVIVDLLLIMCQKLEQKSSSFVINLLMFDKQKHLASFYRLVSFVMHV